MLRSLQKPLRKAFAGSYLPHLTAAKYSVDVSVGPEHYDLPAGHKNSDMRDTSCNIGLNRRRDLTLRQDLCFWTTEGKHNLTELFKGQTSVIFGVPDMGKVCSEKHVPSFVKGADELRSLGVKDIFCIAVAPPDKADAWAKHMKLPDSKIVILADKNASFARLLGVDLELPDTDGPYQQRFAALLEDGVLLKLKVEHDLKDVKEASSDSIVDCIKSLQALD